MSPTAPPSCPPPSLLFELIPTLMVLAAFLCIAVMSFFARRTFRRGYLALAQAKELRAEIDRELGNLVPSAVSIRRDGEDHPVTIARIVLVMPAELGAARGDDTLLVQPPVRGVEFTVIPHGDVRMLFEVGS